jgi:hypothetical protein
MYNLKILKGIYVTKQWEMSQDSQQARYIMARDSGKEESIQEWKNIVR